MFQVICALDTSPDQRWFKYIEAGSHEEALRLASAALAAEPVGYHIVSIEPVLPGR